MENQQLKNALPNPISKGSNTIDFVCIDVRDPEEFALFHMPNSINIPMPKIRPEDFEEYSDKVICLICNTGMRARAVAKKLDLYGFDNVYIAKKQLKDLDSSTLVTRSNEQVPIHGWTVDRQFRMTLGVLLATFLVLFFYGITTGILIPIVLASGLIITSIIDKCYMRIGIGMLPWNR